MGALPVPREARRLPESRALRLTWRDEHVGDYPYDYLRGWCPCAGCQGHAALTLAFHPPRSAVDLARVESVGNYALSFSFSDGHATGIYRFDLLRDLCPCPLCSPPGTPPPSIETS